MAPAGLAARPIWHIALNTLREAIRQRFCWLLAVMALLAVLGARSFRAFHFGSPELKFIADVGGGALACFGPVMTIVATTQLFYGEIERRTALTLLAKPVARSEFLLGKFLGVAILTGAFCAVLTLVLLVVLWTREASLREEFPAAFSVGSLVNLPVVVFTGLAQWLKLLVLSALTLLVASYARTQLFATVTGFVLWVICELQHFAMSTHGPNKVMAALSHVFPNFRLFDSDESRLSSLGMVLLSLYALAYMSTACALAIACFRRR